MSTTNGTTFGKTALTTTRRGFSTVKLHARVSGSDAPQVVSARRYLRKNVPGIYQDGDFGLRFLGALEETLGVVIFQEQVLQVAEAMGGFTAGEADQVMNQCDIEDTIGLRDRAILETFYSTGMRRMELVNLAVYHLDMERGTLVVRKGKWKRDRVIPIGGRALAWIEKPLDRTRMRS